MDRTKEIEQSIIKKYRKQIWRKFVKGVQTYDMIQPNDKIAVCISGGKDSMLMAKLLQELKRHGKFDFELVFLSMDPGYNEKNRKKIVKSKHKRSSKKILGAYCLDVINQQQRDIEESLKEFLRINGLEI